MGFPNKIIIYFVARGVALFPVFCRIGLEGVDPLSVWLMTPFSFRPFTFLPPLTSDISGKKNY